MLKVINGVLSHTIVIVAVMILSLFSMWLSIMAIPDILAENKELSKQQTQLKADYDNNLELLELINNQKFQESMARKQYQLSESNELLFRFVELDE